MGFWNLLIIDNKVHKRFFSWFIIWYSIETLIFFSIFLSHVFLSGNYIIYPIHAILIICGGSLEWPAIVLFSLVTGYSQTSPFFLLYSIILISSILSILIECKYNISCPVVSNINKKFDAKVLDEILALFFIYYVLSGIVLFFIFLSAQSINNVSDLPEVLFGCFVMSTIWFFLLFIMMFFLPFTSHYFLVPFGLFVIFLFVSLVLKYRFNVKFSKVFDLISISFSKVFDFIHYSVLSTFTRKIKAKGLEEILNWFLIYYVLTAIMFFMLFISQLIDIESSNNLNPSEFFWGCILVSTVWPLILLTVLLFLDVSPTLFFFLPFGLLIIFLIISLVLKYGFNVKFSRVFDLINKTR